MLRNLCRARYSHEVLQYDCDMGDGRAGKLQASTNKSARLDKKTGAGLSACTPMQWIARQDRQDPISVIELFTLETKTPMRAAQKTLLQVMQQGTGKLEV